MPEKSVVCCLVFSGSRSCVIYSILPPVFLCSGQIRSV